MPIKASENNEHLLGASLKIIHQPRGGWEFEHLSHFRKYSQWFLGEKKGFFLISFHLCVKSWWLFGCERRVCAQVFMETDFHLLCCFKRIAAISFHYRWYIHDNRDAKLNCSSDIYEVLKSFHRFAAPPNYCKASFFRLFFPTFFFVAILFFSPRNEAPHYEAKNVLKEKVFSVEKLHYCVKSKF